MAARKTKRKAKAVSLAEAARIVSEATGRPRSQIREVYKGDAAALRATASKKSPARSFARYFYETRITDTQKRIRRGQASREVAKVFYEAQRATRSDRLQIVNIPARQKKYKGFDVSSEGRILKSGEHKGKRRFVYDAELERPISQETAKHLRKENRAIRIANFLSNTPVSQLPNFVKSRFTKSELKRIRSRKDKKPTLRELRLIGKRIAEDWNPRLFHAWAEVFGGYP